MTNKKTVITQAVALGASFSHCRTKKVSFSDLARAETIFIYFDNLQWGKDNKWDELKQIARENGFILGS